jgi:hypothetical protein
MSFWVLNEFYRFGYCTIMVIYINMKQIIISGFVLFSLCNGMMHAQIPNAGFEAWTNMGVYENPLGWDSHNNLTAAFSVFTCEKDTPGNQGAAFLKLTARTVDSLGVVPGVATNGTLSGPAYLTEGGSPFTSRPEFLKGSWQHMIFGANQGYIDVQLSRWDNNLQMRIPVASAHEDLVWMAMVWEDFSIPFIYFDGNNPDTCLITFSSSSGHAFAEDYLFIDNLYFAGDIIGISENLPIKDISIFPNPASGKITLDLSAFRTREISLAILDFHGRLSKEISIGKINSGDEIDISDLASGKYFVKITAGSKIVTSFFVKN